MVSSSNIQGVQTSSEMEIRKWGSSKLEYEFEMYCFNKGLDFPHSDLRKKETKVEEELRKKETKVEEEIITLGAQQIIENKKEINIGESSAIKWHTLKETISSTHPPMETIKITNTYQEYLGRKYYSF